MAMIKAETWGEYPDINPLKRLLIWLTGAAYIGHRTRPGWKGSLPFYAFRCPVHGLVENYPSGYEQRLECPRCLKERCELPMT